MGKQLTTAKFAFLKEQMRKLLRATVSSSEKAMEYCLSEGRYK
mgnify:FL=1